MAIWIVKNSGKISYGIKRYLCDTLEDLPYSENGEVVIPGCKAYVISEKKTYMMGSDEEWHEINEGSGSGASSMSQLTDVDLTDLEDGQVLKYDENTQTWKPGDDASATSLGNLDDVDLTNLQDGQVIIYDSTTEKWLASDIPSDITEVTQAQYDALPSETKNLPIIYQISDKGYFFYKGKKFRASKEMTQAEYDQLTPEEKNDGTVYFITDAPETVAELTQAQYDALTPDEKNNGTIWQISNKGYFYYKGKQFRSSRELTQAEFDALPTSVKNNGTEYLITDATTSIGDIDDVSISNATEGQILTYDETTDTWVNAANTAADKMDKVNPTGTGSLSLNRKAGTTVGTYSVAVGVETTASGNYSVAEGAGTTASGSQSHAEGATTTASGNCAHAEGASATASGEVSHAEGFNTIAASRYQHVGGKNNISDDNEIYAEIIGNGTSSNDRSNARTLDWQGNETLAGDLIINGNRSVANALNGIPTELSELSDVNIASTPEDGQVLSYDATSDKWIAGAPGSSGVELTQAEYDALTPDEKTNGTEYFITDGTNAPVEAASILYDNEDSGLVASDVQNAIDELNYNISNLSSDLEDLEDVNINNIQDGQIIKYDATNQTWVNADDEGGTELPVPTTADIGKSLVVESDGQGGTQYAYDINSCVELTQAEYDALTSEEKNNGAIYQISDKGYFYYKEKKFHQVKELTMAEYNQLTPTEQNNGVEYFITDAPEIVTEITLADYEELTLEEQMNGTIYQIIDCGYFFYKGNRFMASLELTLAEYNNLTLEEQMNGTEYFITDAPEMVTDLTQVEYDALTTDQKNNGSIYQISDKGYCYYKEKQFRATKELTQAQYDALTPEQKADGTIYMISDATNNLGDLDDVNMTSPLTDGDFLMYNGSISEWVNIQPELNDMSDVAHGTPANGDVLMFDSVADKWVNSPVPAPSVPVELNDLNDVDIQNPLSGELLWYSQNGNMWYNKDLLVQNIANVDINTVVTGEILTYDSTAQKWVNSPNVSAVRQENDHITFDATSTVPSRYFGCKLGGLDANNDTFTGLNINNINDKSFACTAYIEVSKGGYVYEVQPIACGASLMGPGGASILRGDPIVAIEQFIDDGGSNYNTLTLIIFLPKSASDYYKLEIVATTSNPVLTATVTTVTSLYT